MGIRSAETLAGVAGDAGLQLVPEGGVVELAADQHQLIRAGPAPVAVVDGEALAS